MAYRDDLEAAQARVAALEQELAGVRAELAERDGASQALVRAGAQAMVRGASGSPAATTWLGGPTQLAFTRVIDGEIPDTAQTELVEATRLAMGNVGVTSVLPGSLAWTASMHQGGLGPFVNVYITYRDGATTIRVDEKLTNLAGGVFGGVGGGAGGGGLAIAGAAALITPWLLPLTIPLWLGGTYAACRTLYRRGARRRAARLEKLADDLEAIAREHIERARASAKP